MLTEGEKIKLRACTTDTANTVIDCPSYPRTRFRQTEANSPYLMFISVAKRKQKKEKSFPNKGTTFPCFLNEGITRG